MGRGAVCANAQSEDAACDLFAFASVLNDEDFRVGFDRTSKDLGDANYVIRHKHRIQSGGAKTGLSQASRRP